MANIFGELLLLVLTDDVSQARAMVGILLRKHTDVPFHHQIIGPSSSVNYLLKLALALHGVFGSLTRFLGLQSGNFCMPKVLPKAYFLTSICLQPYIELLRQQTLLIMKISPAEWLMT